MKNDNDEELQQIFTEGATPNRDFMRKLKREVVSQFSATDTHDNFTTRLFMNFSKPAFRIGTIAIVLSAALGIPSYVHIAQQQQKQSTQILAKIYEVNQDGNKSVSSQDTALGSETGNDADIMMMPAEERKYNYYKTIEEYTYGQAVSACAPMVPYHGYVTRNEYMAFYSSANNWAPDYYKTVAYVGADIYDYALSVKTERWEYRGGKYAMHIINNEPVSNLAEAAANSSSTSGAEKKGSAIAVDLPAPQGDVNSFFGEGTKVLGKTNFKGRSVYKVQWVYNAACDTDTSNEKDRTITNTDANDRSIVVIALADAQTYAIVSESLYLDDVATKNLLFTRTLDDTQRNDVTLSEVQDEFAFKLDVSVKTTDASSFNYVKETSDAILDLIQNSLKQVAYLGGQYKPTGLASQYVSVVPFSQRHLLDRDFYAQTSYGIALYEENKDMYKPAVETGKQYPLFVSNYEGTRTVPFVTVAEFVPSIKGKDMLIAWGIDPNFLTSVGTVSLNVGSQIVSAQVYESVGGGDSEPASVGSSGSGSGDEQAQTFEAEIGQTAPNIMEDPKTSTSKDLYFVFSTEEVSVLMQLTVGISESPKNLAAMLPFKIVGTANRGSLAPLIPQEVSGEPVLLPLKERK